MLNNIVAKIFGSKQERDKKALLPYVEAVNKEFQLLESISNDELRSKTNEIKNEIKHKLQSIDEEIISIKKEIDENEALNVLEKEELFNKIDALEEKRNKELEEVLMEVLPQAFAVVKETARRFKENEEIEVTATLFDKELASRKKNIRIEGDKAIWLNTWEAAGNTIKWDMQHYDVQIIGGVVLHQGKIAEMATGEGKTLVATFPAYLNALAERGVHIVTVNNYLAQRDSEWMGPIFEFHGLSVDCIDKHRPNSNERKKAYQCDITYGTNNEFGFDYLRDNMVLRVGDMVQRKHHFAMVDEVDSVLVDDARTPLIISGPIPKGDEHEFYELRPRVEKLVNAQKKLVHEFLLDAKKKIKEENTKEGGLALFRAYRGLPKNKPLIKYLSEYGIKAIMQKTENYYLQENSKNMPEADAPLYFTIDEKNNQIELTEKGHEMITKEGEDSNFFVLPDIGVEIANIENNTSISDEEKIEKKEALISNYAIKSQRIHTINQLLKSYCLFEKDVDYIVVDNKVKIVDEQTGRVMEGRRYSDGLHQAIEAKENVKVEEATQTYATVSLQNYFRMYHKLAGMTGTAETEAGEFWEIYKLDVVVIPTNRPIIRKDKNDLVFKTVREKFNAVVDQVVELTQKGRPVLVGTTSVEISELVSKMLSMRKINHQVLNAKQHQKEADIVAMAGKPGTVTIATNMAGRGTDIKLTLESKEAGGLAIIGTERHESRRIDRQLRGRSGRQGDPGSSQFYVSLEDNLMRLFGSDRIIKIMDRMGLKEGEVIQHGMVTKSIERAQKKVEENNFGIRKRLLEYDDVMNLQRERIYQRRKNALSGERLQVDIYNMLYDTAEYLINSMQGPDNFNNFKLEVISVLGFDTGIKEEEFNQRSAPELSEQLYKEIVKRYQYKNQQIAQKALPIFHQIKTERGAVIKEVGMPLSDGKRELVISIDLDKTISSEGKEIINALEKATTLAIIDQEWKEHLRDMDDLRQSVQMAVHEQKDPLLIYKFEGYELFKGFINKVNEDIVSFLMKANLPVQDPDQVKEVRQSYNPNQNIKVNKEDAKSLLGGGNKQAYDPSPKEKVQPVRSQKIAGRNDKVSVQYKDGTIKKDVKYKKIEEDLANDLCVLIDQ